MFFVTLISNLSSCGDKAIQGVDIHKKIMSQISQHNYYNALKLSDKYKDSLSTQQILWSQLSIYWDLFRIYELGYYSALKLQQENYEWYLENSGKANREILAPALYFLANNYLLDNSPVKAEKAIKSGMKYIKKDDPLYHRFMIMNTPSIPLSVNDPDYLYQIYLSKNSISNQRIKHFLDKVNIDNNDIRSLRDLDVLCIAIRQELYDQVAPIVLGNNISGKYMQKLSIDNLIVPHIDVRAFYICSNLYEHLYIETVEKLMKQDGQSDFDHYAYERAGWAEMLNNNYSKSAQYFKKWLSFIEQNCAGDYQKFQRIHYQAMIDLCADLESGRYSNKYSLNNTNLKDPIETNGAITYNYNYYYYLKNSSSAVEYFNRLKDYINIFSYKFDKSDPVMASVYIDNITSLAKYYIHNDVSISAKLISNINEFTIGFTLDKLEKLDYANIKAVELFSILPYALKDVKWDSDLISSAYSESRNIPIASPLRELIAFKDLIGEIPRDPSVTLD